ncbi:MAG: copper resistance CopC family protein [Gammaproteobacteria bacterium]
MKRIALFSTLAALFSLTAHAHSHMEKSDPANGSVLATAPASFTLEFSHPVRVTSVTIQKGEGKSEAVTGAPQEAAAKVTIPAPKLSPGSYVVTWRAVSSDNHISSGKLQFTIGTDKAAGSSAPAPTPQSSSGAHSSSGADPSAGTNSTSKSKPGSTSSKPPGV